MLAKTYADDGRTWFILTCEPNRERIAASHFVARGFIGGSDEWYPQGRPKAYLPTEIRLREYTVSTLMGTRRRQRTTIEPIFRGLIFLRFGFGVDEPWRRKLASIPGIHSFQRAGSGYAILSDLDMDEIVRIEYELNDPSNPKLRQCAFNAGDRVRVKEGPWSDHVLQFVGLDDSGRISWLESRIGRISLPVNEIEAA